MPLALWDDPQCTWDSPIYAWDGLKLTPDFGASSKSAPLPRPSFRADNSYRMEQWRQQVIKDKERNIRLQQEEKEKVAKLEKKADAIEKRRLNDLADEQLQLELLIVLKQIEAANLEQLRLQKILNILYGDEEAIEFWLLTQRIV